MFRTTASACTPTRSSRCGGTTGPGTEIWRRCASSWSDTDTNRWRYGYQQVATRILGNAIPGYKCAISWRNADTNIQRHGY